ncbi:23S rRNA pseudouridine(2605) synthase RluB [Utexia brackfieldae]|uniref:23S rRNA pseudouridine(2605) synthase RluB n=1 Tax=Utexia brackfieldae TaxID=3074108 RepID=UPI00370D3F08
MNKVNTEKLQKVLANLGHGSRRELETVIEAGRVSVDGKIAKLGDRIDVNLQPKIRIDGHVIQLRSKEKEICRVLAYYKPEGEICTRNDPEGRATVFDRLPKLKNSRWINIGRLDINTSGLLLFTTDGELANRLMHPRHEIEREYSVRVFGQVSDAQLFELQNGVQLEDGWAAFKSIKAQGGEGINQWFNVVLTEGRNREVRRMWEAIDVQVSRLIRIRYGNILLPKNLPRGGWIELDLTSVNYLLGLVQLSQEEKSKVKVVKNPKQHARAVKSTDVKRASKRRS